MRDLFRGEKGGGECSSRKKTFIIVLLVQANTPVPAEKVVRSGSLWALLLCRAAEGLIEPARQTERERERAGRDTRDRNRHTHCGSRACVFISSPSSTSDITEEGDLGKEDDKKEPQWK